MVNLWALRKHASIKQMLLLLSDRLSGFEISDADTVPEKAIRLTPADDPGFSIYIFTYGQNSGRYGVHLEYPPQPDGLAGQAIEELEDLDFEQLAELLQTHFYASTNRQ